MIIISKITGTWQSLNLDSSLDSFFALFLSWLMCDFFTIDIAGYSRIKRLFSTPKVALFTRQMALGARKVALLQRE